MKANQVLKLINQGIVVRSSKGTNRQSCAFPGICVLPTGRWICSFRAAPIKSSTSGQSVLITWSDDEGKTWSSPIEPFTPPAIEGKPGRFRGGYLTSLGKGNILATLCWVDHSDPSLPFFNDKNFQLNLANKY